MIKTFPFLEISGSNEQIGRAIGFKFRDKIKNRIKCLRKTVKEYENYIAQIDPYYLCVKNAFSQLIKELEATANSANVPVKDYFLMNTHEVYHRAKHSHNHDEVYGGRCTAVVSFNKEGAIIGHNEDWVVNEADDLYVLKATVNGTTFLGLQYCTELAGVSATMNTWGLVQCVNDLNPVSRIGVPKNFMARAILECRSLDEAEALINKTKLASGFNHVLIQNNEVRNIEVAGDKTAVDSVFSRPYVHTNHYLSNKIRHLEQSHSLCSEVRYKRASDLAKLGMTKEDMIELLSATEDRRFSTGTALETISSIVIIPSKNEMYVSSRYPYAQEFTRYKL